MQTVILRLIEREPHVFPFKNENQHSAYVDLAQDLSEHDARLRVATGPYLGGNSFASGWEFDGDNMKQTGRMTGDVIFNKNDAFIPDDDAHMINSKAFEWLINNKAKVCELFPDLVPGHIVAHSVHEELQGARKLSGKNLVEKPLTSYGGRGVRMIRRETLAEKPATRFPVLLEEVIDTSQGIENIIETYHDYRIMVAGDADGSEIVMASVRTPKKGERIKRAGEGYFILVDPALYPPETVSLFEQVDRKLRHFGKRLYTIDCARDASGDWKIIELNAPPGQMSRMDCGPYADRYFEFHRKLLLEMVCK